jgi:hypothetical protein
VGRPTTARPLLCSRRPSGANAAAATGGAALTTGSPRRAQHFDRAGPLAGVLSLRSRAIETPPRRATDRRHRQTTRPPCPLGSDDPRRNREAEWRASVARTESSDRPNAGRRRPTVPLEDGCANRSDAKRSFPRTTLLPSAGSTRRLRTDTHSVATRSDPSRSSVFRKRALRDSNPRPAGP